MPRPKGALNRKGKQSEEERKINKRATSQPASLEARHREYAQRKVVRREKQLVLLTTRILEKRSQLHAVGKYGGCQDPALKELQRLLDGATESKVCYLEKVASITVPDHADDSHINRMLMFTHHCKITHQANGRKPKTLPAFVQKEMQKCALEAEGVTKSTLQNFFRRLFREEVFSPKKLSMAQDEPMCSQISGGSIQALRTLENLTPREQGILPARSSIQRHNYCVESGADSKYIESEVTEDGSIFRISVSCILNEMLASCSELVQHFGRDLDELQTHRPPVIRLAATIDGGALTCHKGFIIYGIKFVQKEFVNLILGRGIFVGDGDEVEGIQSIRLIQMLGFCQGEDNLEHNKRLASIFFK